MRALRLSLFAKIVLLISVFSTLPLLFTIGLFIYINTGLFWTGVLGVLGISLITWGAAFAFARHLTRPIHAFMAAVDRIAKGDFSAFVEVSSHDELYDLSVAFNRMIEDMRSYSEVRVDELLTEKSKTEGIIYSSEDGIILTDQLGHVQLINPKARDILNFSEQNKESLASRPLWSFVNDDRIAVALRNSIEQDQSTLREVNLSTEGVRRFYSVAATMANPSDPSSSNTWIVIILRNVTAEKELNQLKDDFLQGLTHDLRSPMTAIRGYLQVLSEEMAGPLNNEQKKMLRIMENASTKLLHIISNLLDSAKMSAGKLQINLADCNLRQLLPNTVELFTTEAAKKKITLTLDMPEELPAIKVDPTLLERVVINLVGNAIKFTPEGGFVTVKFIDLPDRVQGQIIDTGAGMPVEFMNRIFKKFEQVSGTRGGTGLGLAICKFIVESHYGEITVKSQPGEGTVFTFTFPKGLEQNEKGDIFRIRPSSSQAA